MCWLTRLAVRCEQQVFGWFTRRWRQGAFCNAPEWTMLICKNPGQTQTRQAYGMQRKHAFHSTLHKPYGRSAFELSGCRNSRSSATASARSTANASPQLAQQSYRQPHTPRWEEMASLHRHSEQQVTSTAEDLVEARSRCCGEWLNGRRSPQEHGQESDKAVL